MRQWNASEDKDKQSQECDIMASLATKAKYLKEFNGKPNVPFCYPSMKSFNCFYKCCEKTFVASQKSQFVQPMKFEAQAEHGAEEEEGDNPGASEGCDQQGAQEGQAS